MIKGKEIPRIYTPPLRELTPDTTMGYEIIEFADKILQIELLPWQRWLVIHAFEIVDVGNTWRLRFRNVQVLVARQNGKTTLGCVIALYFLYLLEVGLASLRIMTASPAWRATARTPAAPTGRW